MKDFQMSFEMGGANWLCDIILEAMEYAGKNGFFRKFRGNSYVLIVMIDTNKRGSFFRINKLHDGMMSSIIVPSGIERSGWRDLRGCLMSMLGRDKTVVKGTNEKKVLNGEETQSRAFFGGKKNWRMVCIVQERQ